MTIADRLREIATEIGTDDFSEHQIEALELISLANTLDDKAQELRHACERTIGIYDHAMSVAESIGKV